MPLMLKKILIPIDNSDYSNSCIDIGINLARKFAACLVGSHVYAARLHDDRFKQMENGLPQKYQQEKKLEQQREIHDSLITRGLSLISDSYLDIFEKQCRQADVPFQRNMMEGKNFDMIVKDVEENGYDLVILGILGLGAVERSLIGSVCERVVRRIRSNVLVVKEPKLEFRNQISDEKIFGGKICVALDGSLESLAGLKMALALGKTFDAEVEAVSAFDPHFHNVAFQSLAGVLSEEAGKVFKFKEQEKLHGEIIDKGLAKIYQSHLERARIIAAEQGMEIKTTLLAGKPFDRILQHIDSEKPALLVVGRFGIHHVEGLDIGSTTENLLRLAPCHILIVDREKDRDSTIHLDKEMADSTKEQLSKKVLADLIWTEKAKRRMEKIPLFVRGMVINEIENCARKKGLQEITSEIVEEVKDKWEQGSSSHSN